MSEHRAHIAWRVDDGDFVRGRYSRRHEWSFDGGITVPGSSSPSVVRLPWSDPAAIDPEEAFVASLASCHMLTFLYLAGKAGFQVLSYEDDAVGVLTKNEHGVPWVSRVSLQPVHAFGGDRLPTDAELDELHERSHHECYISQSVKSEVVTTWRRPS
ncbi:MAG TPA: OsmC family protein [Polyangiaceae bacterium]|nr:OsmC family protein [Polyangiaceae bacterium]